MLACVGCVYTHRVACHWHSLPCTDPVRGFGCRKLCEFSWMLLQVHVCCNQAASCVHKASVSTQTARTWHRLLAAACLELRMCISECVPTLQV